MLSILIPSNAKKKHPRAKSRLCKTIDHIFSIAPAIDYEIIVCSPHKLNINHPKVKVVKDAEGNVGSIQPVNQCLKASQGEYFISCPDDHLIHPNCFNIEEFVEGPLFGNRKVKITSTGWKAHALRGPDRVHLMSTGILLNKSGEVDRFVGILAMPAGARSTVDNLLDGLIFNETLLHVAADNFLSYYIAKKYGEIPLFMPDTEAGRKELHSTNDQLRPRDRAAYLSLIAYFKENPDMPYSHILKFDYKNYLITSKTCPQCGFVEDSEYLPYQPHY